MSKLGNAGQANASQLNEKLEEDRESFSNSESDEQPIDIFTEEVKERTRLIIDKNRLDSAGFEFNNENILEEWLDAAS